VRGNHPVRRQGCRAAPLNRGATHQR
jgi:hypothetical protein